MTREKREILKELYWFQDMARADEELGCGFTPPRTYDEEPRVVTLLNRLACLRHYDSVEEMMHDERDNPQNWGKPSAEMEMIM